MDKEHIKGAAQKVGGSLREAAGKASGNTSLETEGRADKASGSVHRAAGDVKDASRKIKDAVNR